MAATAVLDPYGAIDVLHDLFRCQPEDCGDAQLADELRLLHVMHNWIDGRAASTLGVFDARGGAAAEHARSTNAWIQHELHVTPTTAAGRVAVARRARVSPALANALQTAVIGYDHAITIVRALDKLPAEARDAAEQILLATAVNVDPTRLRHVADTIREALAPEVLVTDTETAQEARYLNVSRTIDGRVVIDGILGPEDGALTLAAVNVYATPFGPDDRRTAAQRRADALVDVLRAGLGAATTPVSGGEVPHVTFTVDFSRFLDHQIPTAWTDDTVLAGETVRRILCDARVTRVVTLGGSEVLDIGRASRVWPPAMRRVLTIRDGGCVAIGCDRPPAFTDAHHVIHWSDGGPTSVDNGALLCRHHHNCVHHQGWVLIRSGVGWLAVPPDLAAINAEAAAAGARLPHLPNPGLFPPLPPQRSSPSSDPSDCDPPDYGPPGCDPPDVRHPSDTAHPPGIAHPPERAHPRDP